MHHSSASHRTRSRGTCGYPPRRFLALVGTVSALLCLAACSGGPPPDPTAGLGSLPRVVDKSDADGYIVVDLRTRRNLDPGSSVGVDPVLRFDPDTGRTFFSDGSVLEADGRLAADSPAADRGSEYRRLFFMGRRQIYKVLSTEDALRIKQLAGEREDQRLAESRRERVAEEQRQRAEHVRQAEIRQREFEEALAPILEVGYETHAPVALPQLGEGEAATQRLWPATALASRFWLLVPLDELEPGAVASASNESGHLEAMASTGTLVFECGPGTNSISVTVHATGGSERYSCNVRGGFLTESLVLRDDALGRSSSWNGLPHPFGVSRTEGGHLVLTDGAQRPRAYAALLPAVDARAGERLVAAQRAVSERWTDAIAQAHAQGRAVRRLEFPFWADTHFATEDDRDRQSAIRFIRAIYQRSPDVMDIANRMTGMLTPTEQAFNQYFTAFEMVWHERTPQPAEPIETFEYNSKGYTVTNQWGTVVERREPIAELVKIRTRFEPGGAPAYEKAMERGQIVQYRGRTLEVRRAARMFYDLYPPNSPTAERFETNLYHYLTGGR